VPRPVQKLCHNEVMRRALVAFDIEATGVWLIRSQSETAADSSGEHSGIRAWSDVLSAELLDQLQHWNDDGCRLADGRTTHFRTESEWNDFFHEGLNLARRVQHELGSTWQVLVMDRRNAWTFVRYP